MAEGNGSTPPGREYWLLVQETVPPPRIRRGQEIQLADGKVYRIAGLSLRDTEDGSPLTNALNVIVNADAVALLTQRRVPVMGADGKPVEGEFRDVRESVYDLVHAALRRNYPQATRDDAIDLLDMQCVYEVIGAICNLSGHREMLSRMALGPPARA